MRRFAREAGLLLVWVGALSCKPKPLDDSLGALARTPGLELPASTHGSPPKPEGDEPAKIVVTKETVTVALDRFPIATLPWDPNLGLAADLKPQGRDDFFITPLAHALGGTPAAKRCPAKERVLDEPSSTCAVVIVADAGTPYRIVSELVYTARLQRFTSIALAVRAKAGNAPAVVDLATGLVPCERMGDPASGLCRRSTSYEAPSLVAVTITKGGFAMHVEGRSVAPGCKDEGFGVAIPVAGGRPDHAGLTTCLKTIHGASPELARETVAWLGAEADTPLSEVVAAIDTMRGEPGTEAIYASIGLLQPRGEGVRK